MQLLHLGPSIIVSSYPTHSPYQLSLCTEFGWSPFYRVNMFGPYRSPMTNITQLLHMGPFYHVSSSPSPYPYELSPYLSFGGWVTFSPRSSWSLGGRLYYLKSNQPAFFFIFTVIHLLTLLTLLSLHSADSPKWALMGYQRHAAHDHLHEYICMPTYQQILSSSFHV